MTEENPMEHEEKKRSSVESRRLMDSLSSLGGQVIKGAQKAVGIAGDEIKTGARKVGRFAKEEIRAGAGAVKAQVKETREKRAATAGLKQDYSVKGSTKRYWLDDKHYTVFDPNDKEERELAQQAVQDFRLYGKVEGTQGDRNEVIEAGEAELDTKKLTKDPIISAEASRKLAAGGQFLAHGSVMGKTRRTQEPEEEVVIMDHSSPPASGEEYEDDYEDEEEPVRPQPRRKVRIVSVEDSMRSRGTRYKTRVPGDKPLNVRVPQVKIFSDREMFPDMTGAPKIREDYDEQEPQPKRKVSYRPPDIDATMPRIFSERRGGKVDYKMPDVPSVLPRIHSEQPRRTVRVEYRPPDIAAMTPKIHMGSSHPPRKTGRIEYRPPSIGDILPKIHTGKQNAPRKSGPVVLKPLSYNPPKIGEILPKIGSAASGPKAVSVVAEPTQKAKPRKQSKGKKSKNAKKKSGKK